MDKFETLISTSQVAAAVLANLETGIYELIPLAVLGIDPPADHAARKALGLGFAGVLTLQQDGQLRSALAVPLDDDVIVMLAQAFSGVVAAQLTQMPKPAPKGDSVEWLRKLYDVPDHRKEN